MSSKSVPQFSYEIKSTKLSASVTDRQKDINSLRKGLLQLPWCMKHDDIPKVCLVIEAMYKQHSNFMHFNVQFLVRLTFLTFNYCTG